MFQSTLPRRERLDKPIPPIYVTRFQSTLPRRERLYPVKKVSNKVLFQSTLPRRERRAIPVCFPNQYTVSIHAPTQGATVFADYDYGYGIGFNPRSHAGSDRNGLLIYSRRKRFNPRSHAGSDKIR